MHLLLGSRSSAPQGSLTAPPLCVCARAPQVHSVLIGLSYLQSDRLVVLTTALGLHQALEGAALGIAPRLTQATHLSTPSGAHRPRTSPRHPCTRLTQATHSQLHSSH
jgi:disulfide bond formation protein DsbB